MIEVITTETTKYGHDYQICHLCCHHHHHHHRHHRASILITVWFSLQLFVVDLVDIELLNVAEAAGRRRLNPTITKLSDAIEHGLTGTVDNFRFGVTSLRQCASGDGINTGCSNGTVIATGPPSPPYRTVVVTDSRSINFVSFSMKFGAPKHIIAWLLAAVALLS